MRNLHWGPTGHDWSQVSSEGRVDMIICKGKNYERAARDEARKHLG